MTTKIMYHSGELEVQRLAGTTKMAARISGMFHPSLLPTFKEFLNEQPLLIASSIDSTGKVWASLLTGGDDFIQVVTDDWIELKPYQVEGDPLFENLQMNGQLGILAIEPASRSRIRLNGRATIADDKIVLHTEQVYGNCQKYIQKRVIEPIALTNSQHTVQLAMELEPSQQDWLSKADTFFVASYNPEGGADASHRGGFPGFIKILNANRLVWPDYSGNKMFNTLGNIQANGKAGLLFVDFEQGNTLQLTGTASIIWDKDRIAEFAGAERLVEFEVERVIEISAARSLQSQFKEYSPFLPR